MIGLVVREPERLAAAEFFELFKTPWEFYQAGREYEVILTSTGEVPEEAKARVVVVYGAAPGGEADRPDEAKVLRTLRGAVLRVEGRPLPIYGETALFETRAAPVAESAEGICAWKARRGEAEWVRVGYNLFEEVRWLLSRGQPLEHAMAPALDLHIALLRGVIARAGVPVVEVPPSPFGTPFITCLTHDIDFVYLRQHGLDHSALGFLYRATLGSAVDFAQGRKSLGKVARNWLAALKFPLVHLGVCRDFWQQFDGFMRVEKGKPSTFFVIPFKGRPGKSLTGADNWKRATRYDIGDVPEWMAALRRNGCEVALHGIDAWSSESGAKEESARIGSVAGEPPSGLRMHWLYFSEKSPEILDGVGFEYDSTCGYNDAVGYRAGTGQVFRPLGMRRLLELPMHIQDTALFYPGRMHLREKEAWERCVALAENAARDGGVLTVLWHDRSLAPERLWGEFYAELLEHLEGKGTWFATAEQVARWFRARREIQLAAPTVAEGGLEISIGQVRPEYGRDFALRVTWANGEGRLEWKESLLKRDGKICLELPIRDRITPTGGVGRDHEPAEVSMTV